MYINRKRSYLLRRKYMYITHIESQVKQKRDTHMYDLLYVNCCKYDMTSTLTPMMALSSLVVTCLALSTAAATCC